MSSTSRNSWERPVGLTATDHQVIERIDAQRQPDRIATRFFCRNCHRQEDALVWFIRDPCPDA